MQLVVIEPFDTYARGDVITDAALIAALIDGRRAFVTPVSSGDAPQSATGPATGPSPDRSGTSLA